MTIIYPLFYNVTSITGDAKGNNLDYQSNYKYNGCYWINILKHFH